MFGVSSACTPRGRARRAAVRRGELALGDRRPCRRRHLHRSPRRQAATGRATGLRCRAARDHGPVRRADRRRRPRTSGRVPLAGLGALGRVPQAQQRAARSAPPLIVSGLRHVARRRASSPNARSAGARRRMRGAVAAAAEDRARAAQHVVEMERAVVICGRMRQRRVRTGTRQDGTSGAPCARGPRRSYGRRRSRRRTRAPSPSPTHDDPVRIVDGFAHPAPPTAAEQIGRGGHGCCHPDPRPAGGDRVRAHEHAQHRHETGSRGSNAAVPHIAPFRRLVTLRLRVHAERGARSSTRFEVQRPLRGSITPCRPASGTPVHVFSSIEARASGSDAQVAGHDGDVGRARRSELAAGRVRHTCTLPGRRPPPRVERGVREQPARDAEHRVGTPRPGAHFELARAGRAWRAATASPSTCGACRGTAAAMSGQIVEADFDHDHDRWRPRAAARACRCTAQEFSGHTLSFTSTGAFGRDRRATLSHGAGRPTVRCTPCGNRRGRRRRRLLRAAVGDLVRETRCPARAASQAGPAAGDGDLEPAHASPACAGITSESRNAVMFARHIAVVSGQRSDRFTISRSTSGEFASG